MVIGARFFPTGFINKFSKGTFACLSGMHAVCFHLCFHLEAALTASSCSHFMVYLTDMPAPSHLCALLLPLQLQTEAAGTLSITFKWFNNDANTDENNAWCDCCDDCDPTFYACTNPNIECSRADISGNHGSHHEKNVDQNEFQNRNPFTADYPVGCSLFRHC